VVALIHLTAAEPSCDTPLVRHGGIARLLFVVLSGLVIAHANGHWLVCYRRGDSSCHLIEIPCRTFFNTLSKGLQGMRLAQAY
jgi:hypothetical protein